MGSTRWSDDHYKDRARLRARTGKDAFEYDHAIRTGQAQAHVHQKMNPHGVRVRESCDSAAHPESLAIGVLLDVTGSMQTVPRILQANLPRLMGLLIRKGYVEHPQILIGGIGDATCDVAPLQVGQFESGIEIEEDLGKLFLEGGGGGQVTESYELAMYFMARHTSIDCQEKRGKRGYLFIIGDEAPYPKVKKNEVQGVIGDKLQADIPINEMIEELQRSYDVYFVIPKLTACWDNKAVHRRWVTLLGQNVLRLEEPAGICELIAATIGFAEGKVDLDHLTGDLEEEGFSGSIALAVGKALTGVSTERAGKAAAIRVPESGGPSGLTEL